MSVSSHWSAVQAFCPRVPAPAIACQPRVKRRLTRLPRSVRNHITPWSDSNRAAASEPPPQAQQHGVQARNSRSARSGLGDERIRNRGRRSGRWVSGLPALAAYRMAHGTAQRALSVVAKLSDAPHRHVGQVVNLRRVGNPPVDPLNGLFGAGSQPARRMSSCPTTLTCAQQYCASLINIERSKRGSGLLSVAVIGASGAARRDRAETHNR